jgi:hypothetical protein
MRTTPLRIVANKVEVMAVSHPAVSFRDCLEIDRAGFSTVTTAHVAPGSQVRVEFSLWEQVFVYVTARATQSIGDPTDGSGVVTLWEFVPGPDVDEAVELLVRAVARPKSGG